MIAQRTYYDCGICSLAMAMNTSYEAIIDSWTNDVNGLGVTAQETVAYLYLNGYLPVLIQTSEALSELDDTSRLRYLPTQKMLVEILLGQHAILTVTTASGQLHAVYYNGTEVFDPAHPEPRLLESYNILEAIIIHERARNG